MYIVLTFELDSDREEDFETAFEALEKLGFSPNPDDGEALPLGTVVAEVSNDVGSISDLLDEVQYELRHHGVAALFIAATDQYDTWTP